MLTWCSQRSPPGQPQVSSFSLKKAFPLYLAVGGISELPPAATFGPQVLALHSSGPVPLPSANQVFALTETLGVLARAVGEPMRPLAEECCQVGLGLCDQVDDPDLRRCT